MSDTGWKSPTLAYSESWVDYDNVLIDDLSYSYSRDVIVFDDFAISIVGDGFESVDKQGVAESEVTFVSFGGSNDTWGETWTSEDLSDLWFAILIKPIKSDSSDPDDGLAIGGFEFNIPEDATIEGIEVRVKIKAFAGDVLNLLRCYYVEAKVHYTTTPVIGEKYPLPAFGVI